MASKLLWLKFYGDDFFGDEAVKLMDDATLGRYLRLLWHSWKHNGLPADPADVARIAGCTALEAGPLTDRFPIDPSDGRRRNPRQERERAEMEATAEGRRRGGLVSKGNLKHQNNGSPSADSSADVSANPTLKPSAGSRLRASSTSTASQGSPAKDSPESKGGVGEKLERELRDGLAAVPDAIGLLDLVLLGLTTPAKRFAAVSSLRALGPGGVRQQGEWIDVALGFGQAVKTSDNKFPNDNYLSSCVANAKRRREQPDTRAPEATTKTPVTPIRRATSAAPRPR